MSVATIFGGSHGLGLATAQLLASRGFSIELVGRDFSLAKKTFTEIESSGVNVKYISHDFLTDNLSDLLQKVSKNPAAVFYVAGIGRLEHFVESEDAYIRGCYAINAEVPTLLLKSYYENLSGKNNFYYGHVTSIAGQLVSPLFSVYAASKAAASRLIETVNIELKASGCKNRITDFCPGNFAGSSFSGGDTDLSKLHDLSSQLVDQTFAHTGLFIPDYDTIYKSVIERYQADGETFGISSYKHKIERKLQNE